MDILKIFTNKQDLALQAAGEKLANEVFNVGSKVLCHASFDTDASKAFILIDGQFPLT